MKLIWYLSLAFSLIVLYKLIRGDSTSSSLGRHPVPGTLEELLLSSELFLNETNIRITWPIALHGRVDQVFRLADGRLIVLDTKVRDRPRIFLSDLVQITVYAIILKYMGHPICPTGVIRIVCRDHVTYQPVSLLPESQVIQLYQRYIAIASGSILPTCTCGRHRVSI